MKPINAEEAKDLARFYGLDLTEDQAKVLADFTNDPKLARIYYQPRRKPEKRTLLGFIRAWWSMYRASRQADARVDVHRDGVDGKP